MSVEANDRVIPERIRVRETNENDPPMKRRNVEVVVETGGVSSLWDKLARCLMTGRATTGVEGA